MKQVLWTLFFLQSQGCNVTTNLLEQDNASAMQLEKNGKFSSSKNTRHVNIRCFFITDQIEKGHVAVEHVPTDKLIADYLSKPLQGTKFQEMRQILMNSLDRSRQVMRSRTVAPVKLRKLLRPEVDESQRAFLQQQNNGQANAQIIHCMFVPRFALAYFLFAENRKEKKNLFTN